MVSGGMEVNYLIRLNSVNVINKSGDNPRNLRNCRIKTYLTIHRYKLNRLFDILTFLGIICPKKNGKWLKDE